MQNDLYLLSVPSLPMAMPTTPSPHMGLDSLAQTMDPTPTQVIPRLASLWRPFGASRILHTQ
jgi:hypothetical protein